jgi:hypothetical protein
MKIISYSFVTLAVLVFNSGCRTGDTHATSRSTTQTTQTVRTETTRQTASEANPQREGQAGGTIVQQGSTGDSTYTIEMIPNPRLTATSREGDKPTEVYSSNIIAVYVHPKEGVKVSSTNASAAGQAAKK